MNTDDDMQTENRESDGVDEEDTSSEEISRPFDPNKIRVTLWTPTLDLLLKRIKEGEIDLSPDFQRKAGIWKNRPQSQLIESILIRIPLPAFYMDRLNDTSEGKEDVLAVIDGIQRLTALSRFVHGGGPGQAGQDRLRLVGLEFLKDLENKTFDDLPRTLRRRIEETMVTVNVIEKGTPIEAKLNLFKRINTGGMTLTAQEIRHAINPGEVRGFLKTLAESSEFKLATTNSVSPDRMDDRECVLRFFAFVLTPPESYAKVGNLDTFLNSAMHTVNGMRQAERTVLAARFKLAMKRAHRVLGKYAFRKLHGDPIRRGRLNKALFEAWSVALDSQSEAQINRLAEGQDRLIRRFVEILNRDESFSGAISQGTGDVSKVRYRFKRIQDLIQESLK